jgi:hypothetical protein
MYSSRVAELRGATIHRHEWLTEAPEATEPEVEEWARGEAVPVLDVIGATPLVIGKSLGTGTAGLIADRSLPAVWLTPLLTVPWCATALGRATAPLRRSNSTWAIVAATSP